MTNQVEKRMCTRIMIMGNAMHDSHTHKHFIDDVKSWSWSWRECDVVNYSTCPTNGRHPILLYTWNHSDKHWSGKCLMKININLAKTLFELCRRQSRYRCIHIERLKRGTNQLQYRCWTWNFNCTAEWKRIYSECILQIRLQKSHSYRGSTWLEHIPYRKFVNIY